MKQQFLRSNYKFSSFLPSNQTFNEPQTNQLDEQFRKIANDNNNKQYIKQKQNNGKIYQHPLNKKYLIQQESLSNKLHSDQMSQIVAVVDFDNNQHLFLNDDSIQEIIKQAQLLDQFNIYQNSNKQNKLLVPQKQNYVKLKNSVISNDQRLNRNINNINTNYNYKNQINKFQQNYHQECQSNQQQESNFKLKIKQVDRKYKMFKRLKRNQHNCVLIFQHLQQLQTIRHELITLFVQNKSFMTAFLKSISINLRNFIQKIQNQKSRDNIICNQYEQKYKILRNNNKKLQQKCIYLQNELKQISIDKNTIKDNLQNGLKQISMYKNTTKDNLQKGLKFTSINKNTAKDHLMTQPNKQMIKLKQQLVQANKQIQKLQQYIFDLQQKVVQVDLTIQQRINKQNFKIQQKIKQKYRTQLTFKIKQQIVKNVTKQIQQEYLLKHTTPQRQNLVMNKNNVQQINIQQHSTYIQEQQKNLQLELQQFRQSFGHNTIQMRTNQKTTSKNQKAVYRNQNTISRNQITISRNQKTICINNNQNSIQTQRKGSHKKQLSCDKQSKHFQKTNIKVQKQQKQSYMANKYQKKSLYHHYSPHHSQRVKSLHSNSSQRQYNSRPNYILKGNYMISKKSNTIKKSYQATLGNINIIGTNLEDRLNQLRNQLKREINHFY